MLTGLNEVKDSYLPQTESLGSDLTGGKGKCLARQTQNGFDTIIRSSNTDGLGRK